MYVLWTERFLSTKCGFLYEQIVCAGKAALFIEEELPITGYNLKKMGFWGKNLFPTRWMYLGYNMISMTTLVYQKAVERLFHVLHLKSNEYTPPRPSEMIEKN